MATEVDQKLIDYILKFYFDTGFYPNYEEILEGMKWNSKSTVALHMQRLEREGVIVRKEYGSSQYKLNNIDVVEMAKELAEYKKLDEQGLLLKLPCKVGDTVYTLNTLKNKRIVLGQIEEIDAFFIALCMMENRFGKTVFLTKEAAEAKLKEMEGK